MYPPLLLLARFGRSKGRQEGKSKFWTYQKKSFRALIPRPPMLFFTKSAQNWPSKENCYCSVAQQSRVRQQCGFGFNVFRLQEKKVIRYLRFFFAYQLFFLMGKQKNLVIIRSTIYPGGHSHLFFGFAHHFFCYSRSNFNLGSKFVYKYSVHIAFCAF